MSISHSWNGTVLTITSDSGTSSADLKGDMGVRGPQGIAGTAGASNTINYAEYGLPMLHLNGDISAMTKENEVSLDYKYGERSGTCKMKWQGSSSIAYPKKNFTIKFDNEFTVKEQWGAQKKYCLKANYIDSTHSRNIVSAKLWGDIVRARKKDGAFDIKGCRGMLADNGELVAGTAPVNGVITIKDSLAVHGFRYLDGFTCENGIVYALEAEIYITSTEATKNIVYGIGNGAGNATYITDKLDTNTWNKVNLQIANYYNDGKIVIELENATTAENMQIKNIIIKRSQSKNEFNITDVTGFTFSNGNDASYYSSLSNNMIKINLGAYSERIYINGKTYPKGKYTIIFTAQTQRAITQVPYEILAGFGNSSTANTAMVAVDNPYENKSFAVEVENNIDGAYLTIQPMGGANCTVPESMLFSFFNIAVYSGALVEGNNNLPITSSPNCGAIDGFPVVIMLNNTFYGLYTLNIPKDAWAFGMGSGSNEAILCADYSAASRFNGEATLNGDFDLEYVSDKNSVGWVTTSINRLINAVINSDGTNIDSTIAQYLDIQSAIDYMLFVSVICGNDMIGKNYILVTYDGVKWFFSAYDMDTTYGLEWDGSKFNSAFSPPLVSNTGHRLFELLATHKKDVLKARYKELRETILSEDNVALAFENFAKNIPTPIYNEDIRKWATIPSNSVNSISQIRDWYRRRVAVVDKDVDEM